MLEINKKNSTHVNIKTTYDIFQELYDHFSVDIPGVEHNPKYKMNLMDGKKHFLWKNGDMLYGLKNKVINYCKDNEIEYKDNTNEEVLVSTEQFKEFYNLIKEELKYTPYKHQILGVYKALTNRRNILLSATGCLDKNSLIKIRLNSKHKKEITIKRVHELYNTNEYDIEIETPDGWCDIIGLFNKESEGVEITLENDKTIKCADTHLLYTNNKWIYARDLKAYDTIQDKDFKEVNIIETKKVPNQLWYDFSVQNENEWYIQNDMIHHNSGKSLIIYLIIRYMIFTNQKSFIIVPGIDLVSQLQSDFNEYFYDKEELLLEELKNSNEFDKILVQDKIKKIHETRKALKCNNIEDFLYGIQAGVDKTQTKEVNISTYQSLCIAQDRVNADYFDDTDCLIIDECIHPDSIVETLKGLKKIRNVTTEDKVLTFNEVSKQREFKDVVKVHKNLGVSSKEKMYRLDLHDNSSLLVTGNHKVNTLRGWIRVDMLTLEDEVIVK